MSYIGLFGYGAIIIVFQLPESFSVTASRNRVFGALRMPKLLLVITFKPALLNETGDLHCGD